MNDYVAAGASYFTCCAAGRWDSLSILEYHRMQADTAHAWQRKAMHTAFARAHASGPPPDDTALATTEQSEVALTDGRPVSKTPAQLPPALAKAAGKIDWLAISSRPPERKTRKITLDQWLISLPKAA